MPPLLVRLHGEPYVFRKYSHQRIGIGERLNRKLEYIALRRAARVTSPSHFQALEVAGELGWPAERVHVIPNPVSSWLIEQASSPPALSGEDAAPVVLYTGRIEDRKGIVPLLRSVPLVARHFPSVRYVIAGGRHTSIDDNALEQLLNTDGVGKHVQLLGHIPWHQLADWYRQATIFVMPSFYETFGIACLEAMVFGLPIVATTAGGLPEVVEDGVVGLLTRPGDPAGLAEAIISLLSNQTLRSQMGRAGRARVLEHFTAERVAQETLRVYTELCVSC